MMRFRVQNFRFTIDEDKELALGYGMAKIFDEERNGENLAYSLP